MPSRVFIAVKGEAETPWEAIEVSQGMEGDVVIVGGLCKVKDQLAGRLRVCNIVFFFENLGLVLRGLRRKHSLCGFIDHQARTKTIMLSFALQVRS